MSNALRLTSYERMFYLTWAIIIAIMAWNCRDGVQVEIL